LVKVRLFLAG